MIGTNAIIDQMRDRPGRIIVRTNRKRAIIYTYDGSLHPLGKAAVERMIERGILVPREPSAQTFELSPVWKGQP